MQKGSSSRSLDITPEGGRGRPANGSAGSCAGEGPAGGPPSSSAAAIMAWDDRRQLFSYRSKRGAAHQPHGRPPRRPCMGTDDDKQIRASAPSSPDDDGVWLVTHQDGLKVAACDRAPLLLLWAKFVCDCRGRGYFGVSGEVRSSSGAPIDVRDAYLISGSASEDQEPTNPHPTTITNLTSILLPSSTATATASANHAAEAQQEQHGRGRLYVRRAAEGRLRDDQAAAGHGLAPALRLLLPLPQARRRPRRQVRALAGLPLGDGWVDGMLPCLPAWLPACQP